MFALKLSLDFTIETEFVCFRFEQGASKQAMLRRSGREMVIVLPEGFDFAQRNHLLWANRALAEVLRARAQEVLPVRFAELASRWNIRFHRIYIKNVSTRWGSCSSLGNVNLSLWLMLAPTRLIDYVLVHEMAHLNEMSHSARFWAEVDRFVGGGAGSGKRLEREMKSFARSLPMARM